MKHIVGFSGGIDSQACARWVLNRYPAEDVVLLNSDAGKNENGLTMAFVDWYSANVHPVITITPIAQDLYECSAPKARVHVSRAKVEAKGFQPLQEITFGDMMELKGRGPSSQAQFCTDILKIRPQLRWINENLKGVEYERYTGVRRDESRNRKDTPLREWDDFYDCWLNNPLAEWTKLQCFAYVKEYGELVNPLYSMGFSRVGCSPCVNWSKDDIAAWAIRFPEDGDKIRRWEKQSGRTFFPPAVPGLAFNFIDEVIAWAKTSRGGRQSLLPIMHERPACESKYGLCE